MEQTERPGKFTHCRVTVILRPTSYKNHPWVAMKVVCKPNDYILGRKCEATQTRQYS